MKQSTFSAVMANNLLTLLQGYSKTIRLLLIMFLTLTVTTNAWAEEGEATITFSNAGLSNQQSVSGTSFALGDYFTVTYAKNGSSTNPTYYTSGTAIRCYVTKSTSNGNTITINQTAKGKDVNAYITSVTYSGTNKQGTTSFTYSGTPTSSSNYSVTYSDASKVTSVVATLKETGGSKNGQFYSTGITIRYTYTSSGGGGSTPTQLSAPTGLTANNITSSGATLSWNAVANASSYTLQVYGENDDVIAEYTGLTQTTKEVSGLEPETYYVWGVTAIGNGTTYEDSNEETADFTTSAPAGGDGGDGKCSWVETDISSIKSTDIVVITMTNSSGGTYAMSNNNGTGSAPTATKVTVSGTTLTSSIADNLKWNISNSNGTLTIYPNEATSTWLYCTATNNGVRVGTNTNKTFTIDASSGYLKHTGTSRYLGVYNSQDWRCYTSTTTNIADQTLKFYVYQCSDDGGDDVTPTQLTKPTNLKVSNVTTTTATLSWDAVANASGYTVVVGSTSHNTNATSITVENLTASTTYKWNVTAKGDGSTYTDSDAANGSDFTTATPAPTNYTVTLNPNYPTGKTGVFKDKEGNIINGNLEVLLPSGTASQALTNFYSSIELDNYAFDGFYTQAEGGSKRVNTGDITGNITFYAHWKEKYTITWSVNGNTSLIEPTTFAAGDNTWEMPTTDYDCSGKGFVGWTTNPIIAAQDEAPDPLYTNASQFPNATATYHAVFAEGGSGSSGGYEKLTETLDDYSGEYLIVYETDKVAFNGGLTTLDATSNYISVTIIDDVIVSNATTDAAKFTFAKVDGGYSILSASGKYIGREANSNGLNATPTYAAGYLNTITYNSITGKGGCTLKYNSASDQKRFRYFVSGQQAIALYKKSGSSATYTAYTTSCVASYSITYNFAGGTGSHCSNTSVPQGDTYTICDDAPTKEGNTFLHWSDGTSTYVAGATITPTGDVTLTAVWKANTYTVTWNNNGDTDEVTYNHGVALVVPTAPASCDGVKEFVGWTTHSGYYHATTAPDDIFTTKTTPVTATATYYAVFATPGAGGTEFVLGESGTFKMYANVDGTNHYAQGGVSSSKLSSTTDILTASDYTLTYADGSYTIKQGTSAIGHSSKTDLTSTASTWTISAGVNGSWRITSDKDNSRALSYSAEANAFKAYATSNLTAGNETYFDIEFGSGSDAHSDYTTICQTVESIEIADYTTEFFVTDEFAFGGTVTAHFDGGGTQDVTALAHFSGYNMNVTGTYTVTVTYMGATATYEITVKPLDNAWVLTWNVSGKTNTGLGPRSVTKGSAIGTLPTPVIPDACAGKTFMGWTESNVVNSDGSGITYINEGTVPTANTTYYAVFATVNNFSVQKPINDITDGSKVVIVAVASLDNTGSTGKAISSRTISTTSKGVIGLAGDDVAIFDETINTPHSTCIWTLTKQGETVAFKQGSKYIRATDAGYRRLVLDATADYWTLITVAGKDKTYHMKSGNTSHYVEWFDHTDSKYDEGERYIGFIPYTEANNNGDFDMQFFVVAGNGEADITDYTTGCAEYTITYYGFQGGYSTSCSSDGTIVLPVNSLHTIPNCGDVVKDHTNLNRTFTGVWMTKPHGGQTFKSGDTFILTQDTTLYAQWELNTQNDFTTLPTDVEDLAGTDIYVYGGKTLTLQPGTTTINSLTLKGGIQADGSYQMPSVWVPEGATLVRNSNKIYLDLVVNAENWYPFAVPFETKNTSDIHYLHPDMKSAATYSKHFDIKTYDGARRADVGEDKTNNWVRLKRHTPEAPVSFKPGVGYIISAMAYPGTDTATIRIPMTVPNTWFKNGEQAVVGTTVRNTIAVTAHTGTATDINNGGHQRHAGWNFVANPYLSNFTGGGIDATNGLDYIDGELIIQGSYEYSEETVPYVTIPAYNFAYYSQHKLSDVKLSPEWSFFVQVGTSGTMDFTTTGRQQAPASIAARAEERPVKMDVDITLSDNHSSDQTGIIISDRYNDTYEIGRDLEKLFGSAYNLSVYTLMADNTPLAYQALAIRSNMQVIPVGYRAPEQGEYTFRLNEATSSIDLLNEQYEQLVLVDYQTGELTNLLISDYTFYSERTQADNRFAIYAVPRQNAPTDLPNAIGQDKQAQKIIHNGHLYILRDGNVYNGNGQIVK